MKETVNRYLKLFGEWATALRERYGSDLFFRTSLNIVTLQVGFVLVVMSAFFLALHYSGREWYVLGVVLVAACGFGALLAKLTLKPARDNLRNQKLFISNVAHELRTPLSTIKTSSEVALIDTTMPKDTRATFREILEELERISEIINNLLSLNTLSRPERMHFQNLDLAPLAQTVVRKHLGLARERGIRLRLHTKPGAIVWGNQGALEQVMQNIVKNALLYTPENTNGAVDVRIEPQTQEGTPMVLFAVEDTGIGISQDDLFHIFEPFFRADTSRVRKVARSGSGLGLTIVNEMVRAHHGKIQIQSRKRKGTVVSVLIPMGGSRGTSQRKDKEDRDAEASLDFSMGTTNNGLTRQMVRS